ncbi:hypothetical protein [Bradyrhizobium canariense]|uniref:hypothetical protein n=1 Tax=Bradyrhizobium canariense TaxID=255045 RepID=UPI000A214C79|nr:hypothetical protein [Bradyrhizobium canariense]OSI53609.1 hypothetical protein BSZ15_25075 [Bradyrhizobium canariense]
MKADSSGRWRIGALLGALLLVGETGPFRHSRGFFHVHASRPRGSPNVASGRLTTRRLDRRPAIAAVLIHVGVAGVMDLVVIGSAPGSPCGPFASDAFVFLPFVIAVRISATSIAMGFQSVLAAPTCGIVLSLSYAF